MVLIRRSISSPDMIQPAAITTEKIADQSVTVDKMSPAIGEYQDDAGQAAFDQATNTETIRRTADADGRGRFVRGSIEAQGGTNTQSAFYLQVETTAGSGFFRQADRQTVAVGAAAREYSLQAYVPPGCEYYFERELATAGTGTFALVQPIVYCEM